MPATFIQSATQAGTGANQATFANPTPAGRLVTVHVGASRFNGTCRYTSLTDNLGNSYTIVLNPQDAITGAVMCGYSYITIPGTITVSAVATAGDNGAAMMIREYDFPNSIFDQLSVGIGFDGAQDPNNGGLGTNLFSLADTLAVSCMGTDSSNPSPFSLVFTSATGDTLLAAIPGGGFDNGVVTFWERALTGPGVAGVNLHCTDPTGSGFHIGQFAVGTMTFSAPLSRPFGVTAQNATRPGYGGILGAAVGQSDVIVSLPYVPNVGDLLVVGGGVGNFFGNNYTFAVSDTYGNTYTQRVACPVGAGGVGTGQCAIFTCIVASIPSSGVFQLKLHLTLGGGGRYDGSAISVSEYPPTNLASIQTAILAGQRSSILFFTSSLSVSADSYMVAFAASGPGFNTVATSWSAGSGYTLRNSLTLPIPDVNSFAETQQERMGLSTLEDKFFFAAGNFDAEITTSNTQGGGLGAMAVIAFGSRAPIGPPAPTNPLPGILIYTLNYRELDTAEQIAAAGPIRIGFTGRLIATDHARKWTRWNVPAVGAALMYRQAGKVQPVFLYNTNAYTLNAAKLTDDDLGLIVPYYTTYFFVTHDQEGALSYVDPQGNRQQIGSGRKLLSYVKAYVSAQQAQAPGTCSIVVTPFVDRLTNPWALVGIRTLSSAPKFDLEWGGGMAQGDRIALQFWSTPITGTDNGFNLQRLTAFLKRAQRLQIRGAAQ